MSPSAEQAGSPALQVERGASLRDFNTFGLPATAHVLVHVRSDADVRRVLDHPEFGRLPKLVLGAAAT